MAWLSPATSVSLFSLLVLLLNRRQELGMRRVTPDLLLHDTSLLEPLLSLQVLWDWDSHSLPSIPGCNNGCHLPLLDGWFSSQKHHLKTIFLLHKSHSRVSLIQTLPWSSSTVSIVFLCTIRQDIGDRLYAKLSTLVSGSDLMLIVALNPERGRSCQLCSEATGDRSNRGTNRTMKSAHKAAWFSTGASMLHGRLLRLGLQGDKLVWRQAKIGFDRCQVFMCKHGGTHGEQEGTLFIQEIGLKAFCSSPWRKMENRCFSCLKALCLAPTSRLPIRIS